MVSVAYLLHASGLCAPPSAGVFEVAYAALWSLPPIPASPFSFARELFLLLTAVNYRDDR